MTTGGSNTYQFGPFRLDPSERLLLRDGHVVSLTPKAFDLLVYLVEHQGRLVEKSTLMAALWPDTIVEEANLAFQVSALRKVLEDGGNGDSLIQTVPTKGYRFAASVTISGSSASARGNRRLLAGAAVVLLAAAAATAVWVKSQWATPVPTPPATTPVFTQLTANPAEVPVNSQAMSPDGKYLAYCDRTAIHVEVIGSGDTQTLPDTRGMEILGWNDDSTGIRAVDSDQTVRTIWDVSLAGGARRRTGLVWPEGAVSLAPDSSALLNVTPDGELRVEPVHGAPRSVLRLAKDNWIRSAVWTLDAKRVFFLRFLAPDLNAGNDALETFPVSGGGPTVVFTAPRGQVIRLMGPPGREGRLLAVIGPRGRPDDNSLWEIPVNVETGLLSSAPRRRADWREGRCYQITQSADGRAALLTGGIQRDVYVAAFDVRTGRLDTPRRLTMSDRDDYPSAWTPDNRGIIFSSSRSGRQRDIYRQDIDRGEPELLVTGEGEKDYTRVTGDGRWILFIQSAFLSDFRGPTRVMRAPIEGGIAQEIYASPGIAWPQCSIAKGCIVYEKRGATGVISSLDPISGKGAELATVPTSPHGCILPDGTEFAYIVDQDRPRNHIRIISFIGKAPKDVIVHGANDLENLDPMPDGSGWFSVNHTSERTELLHITRDGKSHVLWAPDRTLVDSAMSSRDGKHLAIHTLTQTSNVWMMTGF
jgi:DNA-binding winged helix-turn-helix (wHTH) protein